MRTLLLAVLAAGTVWAIDVDVNFDESVDFSKYKTFALQEGKLNAKNPTLNNALVRKNLETQIRKNLTAKKLTEAEGKADLNVFFSLGAQNRNEIDTYPAGWRGRGVRRVRTRVTEGTLVIDLRDTSKRELVWRAVATEEKSDPAKIEDRLDDMVKKSFDKFPPKK